MRRLALAIAIIMSLGLLTAPPAAAWEPSGAVFNLPPPWGTKDQPYRIIKHVERAIQETPGAKPGEPKPEILVTSFLLDRLRSVNALIDACRRGVSVRAIIDQGIETPTSKKLISALNGDNWRDTDGNGTPEPGTAKTGPCGEGEPVLQARASSLEDPVVQGDGEALPSLTDQQARASVDAPLPSDASWGGDQSYVTQCDGSCRGRRGQMHAKFYAFSRTGTADDVVMVSSSNLNAGGALKGWNDLYAMKRVPQTFAFYEQIHDEMGRDERVTGSYRSLREGRYVSRMFPMENASKATDPALQDLNKIRCSSAFGRTKIYISMFYWQGVRGGYLADRILQLAKQGCKVSIIIGAPSREIAKRLRTAARADRIDLWDSRVWSKKRELIVRTHQKYTLVKGTYAGNNRAHLVMTGSANWGHGSLDQSDDNTLNIELGAAYKEYLANWNVVRRHSKRLGG